MKSREIPRGEGRYCDFGLLERQEVCTVRGIIVDGSCSIRRRRVEIQADTSSDIIDVFELFDQVVDFASKSEQNLVVTLLHPAAIVCEPNPTTNVDNFILFNQISRL